MNEYCKILIAEDEYIMRQGIKHLLDWEQEGFQIVGETSNGQEALKLIEELRPHILLTDLLMPVMDGIELVKIVSERYPDIKMLVLSGYSDFDYVKTTFQYGVVDYILKPTLSPEDLLTALKKAAAQIPGLELARDGQMSVAGRLNQLLSGYHTQESVESLREVLTGDRLMMCGADISGLYQPGQTERATALAAQAVEECAKQIPIVPALIDEHILLLAASYSDSQSVAAAAAMRACAEYIAKRTAAFFVCGREFQKIEDIPAEYHEHIEKHLHERFYFSNKAVMSCGEFAPVHAPLPFDASRFSELIRCANFAKALDMLSEYVEEVAACRGMNEIELKAFTQNACYQILSAWEDMGLNQDNLSHLKRDCFIRIGEARSAPDFLNDFRLILEDFRQICSNYRRAPDATVMEEILSYIAEHYTQPLTLNELAEKFNFNYYYLSSYFRNHSDAGFKEYLNKLRVQRAAELLRYGSISVSDVGGQADFTDNSYFTKVFKKYTGKTPSEYRKSFRDSGGEA